MAPAQQQKVGSLCSPRAALRLSALGTETTETSCRAWGSGHSESELLVLWQEEASSPA